MNIEISSWMSFGMFPLSLDEFRHSILPQVVSPIQIDEIATRLLVANGSLQPDGRWTLFPIDPCVETDEKRCFKRLETIATVVVEEAKRLLKRNPTAVMQTRPTQAALCEGCNEQFISDGHYALCESKGARLVKDDFSPPSKSQCPYGRKVALACDRAGIEEYSLKDTWEDENDKILGNAAQMMYADPCRRFMFGMTIANTTTRLWYFSRAMVLVSKPFNFISEYRHIIHYIVSSGIISHATRVWTVRKLGDEKRQEYALKDFWIPLDTRTESEIQQDIFKRIEEKDPDAKKDPTVYKQYFMDIKACEVVACTDGKADSIADLSELYHLYDVKRRPSSPAASIHSTSIFSNIANPVGGYVCGQAQRHHSRRVYTGRKHVRVVFSEVGIPLDMVHDQKMLFTGLLHAYRGLRYLYLASYVHRDMSSGNILLCSGNRGKISDLEFAKVFQSDALESDPKTGTPIFMAVEVQSKHYRFKPTQGTADDAAITSALALIDRSDPFSDQYTALGTPFLHNFYHDAESLWGHFDDLFPLHAGGSSVRSNFLRKPVQAGIIRCLPDEFRPVLRVLDIIRPFLVDAYTTAEAQKNFPQYDNFAELFGQDSFFERALKRAAELAVNEIQPFELEDQSIREGAEDSVEWAVDRLKEENYAGYDAPEDDADTSGGYILPKGTVTKRPIEEVDKAESSGGEYVLKQLRRSSRIGKLTGA
ncbi:hypothetical protein F5146DRAFT_1116900 [Armillaria mellea]|nr:hypothetical protein F5146DRAFT_1116900 [Armillaria mellea]